MRDIDEADPNNPHPISGPRKKAPTLPEALERPPWHGVMAGDERDERDERDRHRHV